MKRCGNRPEAGRKEPQVGAVQGGHAACEGLGPLDDAVCRLALSSLHRIHIRMVADISVAFRSTGLCSSEHARSPLEDIRRGRPRCRSTPSPLPGCNVRLDSFPWGPSPHPCSSLPPCLWRRGGSC